MKPEDKLLFACTRQNFLQEHQQIVLDICRREEINWEDVFSTAVQHSVATLIYVNLQQCAPLSLGIPPDIRSKFERCYYHNIALMSGVAEKTREALAFFNQRSIDVMLIKGAALAILVYDQPWYTTPNDVDLVIKPKREEISDSDRLEFMHYFHRTGIEYDYFEHHDVVMNGALPVDFHQIWNDAAQTTFQGQVVYVMSPEDMLISACINSCRKRFFRLKSLVDIAEIINKHPGLNWIELIRKASAYKCKSIVYTALLVTNMMLGCQLPDQVLDRLILSPVRTAIINYLGQRLSLSSLSSLYSGRQIFGRRLGLSLLLPYATYRWDQVWRKMRYVWSTRSNRLTHVTSDVKLS